MANLLWVWQHCVHVELSQWNLIVYSIGHAHSRVGVEDKLLSGAYPFPWQSVVEITTTVTNRYDEVECDLLTFH